MPYRVLKITKKRQPINVHECGHRSVRVLSLFSCSQAYAQSHKYMSVQKLCWDAMAIPVFFCDFYKIFCAFLFFGPREKYFQNYWPCVSVLSWLCCVAGSQSSVGLTFYVQTPNKKPTLVQAQTQEKKNRRQQTTIKGDLVCALR